MNRAAARVFIFWPKRLGLWCVVPSTRWAIAVYRIDANVRSCDSYLFAPWKHTRLTDVFWRHKARNDRDKIGLRDLCDGATQTTAERIKAQVSFVAMANVRFRPRHGWSCACSHQMWWRIRRISLVERWSRKRWMSDFQARAKTATLTGHFHRRVWSSVVPRWLRLVWLNQPGWWLSLLSWWYLPS